jgi:hypothetical protein
MTILPIASLLLRGWIFHHSQVATCSERVCSFNPSVINMWITRKSPHMHREGSHPNSSEEKTSMNLAGYPFWGSGAVSRPDAAFGLRILHCCYFFFFRNVCYMNLAANGAFFSLTQKLLPYRCVMYEMSVVNILPFCLLQAMICPAVKYVTGCYYKWHRPCEVKFILCLA